MADGDAAAAIGLAILTGTAKVREFFKHVNATRDMLANHITGGTHPASAITTGTLDAARIPNLPATKITSGDLLLPGVVRGTEVISLGNIIAAGQLKTAIGGLSSWTSAVLRNADGTLGIAVSSRRFKQDIKPAPLRRALLAAEVVNYRYIAEVEENGDAAPVEVGFIAENLHELGLTEYVVYENDTGLPLTVRYEMLVCDIVGILQDHETRLHKLEGGK